MKLNRREWLNVEEMNMAKDYMYITIGGQHKERCPSGSLIFSWVEEEVAWKFSTLNLWIFVDCDYVLSTVIDTGVIVVNCSL